jgi:hypothetical protein
MASIASKMQRLRPMQLQEHTALVHYFERLFDSDSDRWLASTSASRPDMGKCGNCQRLVKDLEDKV